MIKKFGIAVAAAASCMVPMPSLADSTGVSPVEVSNRLDEISVDVSAITGIAYFEGDYGASRDTEIWNIPFAARVDLSSIRLTATLPWWHIESPGLVFSGIDGTPLVGMAERPNGVIRETEGFGDLTVGATSELGTLGGFDLEGGLRVKLPTGKDDLSTGKTDVSASLDVSREEGSFLPFATLTYRWFGDPEGWDVQNGFAASAGSAFDTGNGLAIVSYDYARATSTLIDDAHELFAGYSMPIVEGRFRLTGFGTKGLSEGSPDFSAGVTLLANF